MLEGYRGNVIWAMVNGGEWWRDMVIAIYLSISDGECLMVRIMDQVAVNFTYLQVAMKLLKIYLFNFNFCINLFIGKFVYTF